ncbi:GNAT family N-acetyltransferase [Promicromonospora alba]|uniref:GNAT family N-acetyltransferase n=1 Tax=Promicromonospora alba TaxID=1616110 RepID=A0ABV9HC19_9MICO
MFTIRPSTTADRPGVRDLILARSDWLEQRGMESWRDATDSVANLAGEDGGGMWVVQAGQQIIGTTTLQDQAPPEWTDDEAAQPALYLFTTATHPDWLEHRIGTQIAWWALDHAARRSLEWVRRGCYFDGLANLYREQGYTLVRTTQRKTRTVHMFQHRAQLRSDLVLTETSTMPAR